MKPRHWLPIFAVGLAAAAIPDLGAMNAKDLAEASRILDKVTRLAQQLKAANPEVEVGLQVPEPRADNQGKYLCPYRADGSLTPWAEKALQATAGAEIGKAVGKKLGDKAAGELARKIPGGAALGSMLGGKLKSKATETGAMLALGGADYMRENSELSFDSAPALAVYLHSKQSEFGEDYVKALGTMFGIYPNLRGAYEPAIKAAYNSGRNLSPGLAQRTPAQVDPLMATSLLATQADKGPAPALAAVEPAKPVADLPVHRIEAGRAFKLNAKELGRARRVAVTGFRVAFVVKDKVSATVAAGYQFGGTHTSGARSTTEVELRGVDGTVLQEIADTLYAEFVAGLAATGREVVPLEEIKASPSWAGLSPTPSSSAQPFMKNPGMGQSRHVAAISPTALPLWWEHGNQLGDKGPFEIGNYKVMCGLSVELDAVILAPTFLVHFAELSSSGNKRGAFSGYGNKQASTAAKPNLSLLGGDTMLWVLHAKNKIGGEFRRMQLEDQIVIGEYGADLVTLDQASNANDGLRAGLQGLAGSTGNMGFFAAAGPARSSQSLAVRTDPGNFRAHALSALRGVNEVYLAAVRTNPVR
jgi:hypothetical protein